jgi:hypothetical protein
MLRMQQPDSGWLRALGAPHALPEPETPQRVPVSFEIVIEQTYVIGIQLHASLHTPVQEAGQPADNCDGSYLTQHNR